MAVLTTVSLQSCQPDTKCMLEPEIVCYIQLKDTAGKKIAEAAEPLHRDDTIQTLVLTHDTLYIPIEVTYEHRENYVNFACGCFIYQTIHTATCEMEHYEVRIVNSAVESYKQENICVIYNP